MIVNHTCARKLTPLTVIHGGYRTRPSLGAPYEGGSNIKMSDFLCNTHVKPTLFPTDLYACMKSLAWSGLDYASRLVRSCAASAWAGYARRSGSQRCKSQQHIGSRALLTSKLVETKVGKDIAFVCLFLAMCDGLCDVPRHARENRIRSHKPGK